MKVVVQQHNRKKISHLSSKGFTLIELLIYVALVSVIMVVTTDTFISLSKGQGQSEARSEVNTAIRFATDRIREDLVGASAVTVPAINSPSSTLQATVGGTTITYDTLNGQLRRQEGSNTPEAVTGTNIFVDQPTFTRIENYNSDLETTTTSIQISMMFHYNSSSTDWMYSSQMQTTVTLLGQSVQAPS